jgi:UDP-N-acetyl-D-mannosaminuronate dehydrogenase
MSFAVLGLSFREGSKELVNSGSISLIEQLEALNVHKVYVHDPLFTESEISKLGYLPYSFTEAVDCVILHTPHSSYLDLNDKSFLIPPKLILDGRTVLKREHFKQITLKQLGVG